MKVYTVTCAKGSENSFISVNLFDPANVTEFIGHDANGNEVYEIVTEHDIGRQLDLAPGVMEYSAAPY